MAQKYYIGTKLKTLLSGDKVLGRNLIRKARAYTGYLFDQLTENQKYRTQQWNDPDGSKIQVFVWRDVLGERAIARIFVPVVETTGFAEFTLLFEAGSIQIVNEGGGVISTLLHLGDPVSESYTPSKDLNGDAVIDTQDRLFPLGSITYTIEEGGEVTTPIVGDIIPDSYTATDSRVAITNTQKASILLCPASLFSGKMRLYIQSLYGTSRRDYLAYLENPGLSAWPTFKVGSFPISYRSRNSSFLLTTEDYRYFLVTVYFDNLISKIRVTFYEMERYSGDEALDYRLATWALDTLKTEYSGEAGVHNEESAKAILETLVLAQLKPSSTEYFSTYIDYPGSDFDFGSPLEYGWHANWDGSEARIVLITTDSLSYGWGGQTVQLEIGHSIDGESVTFTADAAVVDSGTGKIQNDLFVWIPNGTYQTTTGSWLTTIYMCGIADPENATVIPDPPDAYSNVPLYGWFDNNNTWRGCAITREEFGDSFSARSYPGYVCHGSAENDVSVAGSTASVKYTIDLPGDSVSAQTTGTFDNDIITHRIDTGTARLEVQQLKYHSTAYHLCGPAPFPGWTTGYPELGYWFAWNNPIIDFTISRVDDYSSDARVAFVLAHNDCEAAIGVQHDAVTAHSVSYGHGRYEADKWSDGTRHTAVYEYNVATPTVPGDELWSGTSNRYLVSCTSAQFDPSWNHATLYNVSRKRIRAVLASKDTSKDVIDYQVATNTHGDDAGWDGGDYDIPSPHGTSYGTVDADWEVFTEAPSGVCSSGNRDISLQPSIMVSAIFNSYLGDGTPEDIQNLGNDGFSAGHSFVGWA